MNHGRIDLRGVLRALACEHPSRIALIDVEAGALRTYRELDARTDRVANALRDQGVRPGDTLGLLMHNCIEYLEVLLGAAKLGALTVLVNRRLTVPELAYELESGVVSGVIYSAKFACQAHELSERIPHELWWWESGMGEQRVRPSVAANFEDRLAATIATFEPIEEVDLADAGWVIINTSGTTGKPKAAVLTQANVVAANEFIQRYILSRYSGCLGPVVRQLVMLGMNHIGGLTTVSMPTLAAGGQLVILDDFDPARTLAAIEEFGPNFVFGVGTLWNSIAEQDLGAFDLSSVRVIGTSVAYHTPEQLARLHDATGAEIYYMFGQTETTTGVIITRSTVDLWMRPGTLGRLHGTTEIKIMTPEGRPADTGEAGELWYRGPTVFKEYFGRPADTADAFVGGWFKSGDLVRADVDGYLYFVDRLKDVVKSGGLNVHAFEVEQVISQHPAVADVAVAGVPDERWGEAVTAFVRLTHEARSTGHDADDIIEFCKGRLAGYKVPKSVNFVDEIPVNTLGKKLKRQLVKRLLEGGIV